MPELPDIVLYVESLEPRILGARLRRLRLVSPFLLRTVSPPVGDVEDRIVREVTRLGKRIVIGMEGETFLILHLMIAGRLRWTEAGGLLPGRIGLASLEFDSGRLLVTEAGSKRRASLHLARGGEELRRHDPGGLDLLSCDEDAFMATLRKENHTLKRALTDPRLFDGIGNAYSDEILHRARLSPFLTTRQIDDPSSARLLRAARATLLEWIATLRRLYGSDFPEKVTAFREGMAVHGRFGRPCPACGAPIQRIVYAENEANYCARCQTGGRLLADRSLSRLLKDDWPKTIEEVEERRKL
jgi:formamidopyrimidine-DNA glycosylase